MTSSHGSSQSGGIVVFSGGSAANSLVDVFNTLRETKRCALSYVIPISDNGGSSSELIRVLGGPGECPHLSRADLHLPRIRHQVAEVANAVVFCGCHIPSALPSPSISMLAAAVGYMETWTVGKDLHLLAHAYTIQTDHICQVSEI